MKKGDIVYFKDGISKVYKVEIVNVGGGFAIIKFEGGGGIRVRMSKLYCSLEQAQKTFDKIPEKIKKRTNRPPWDYLW